MSPKLIVADESIIIQKTVELILSEKGFVVKAVSTGKEALRLIKDEIPDIVLADIKLPEMNGYELCSAIKEAPSLKTLPVILLAPAVEGIDEKRAEESGAHEYIIKPFEPEELLSKIDTVMASKDIVAQLRNKLQQLEGKADKINKELIEKILLQVIPEITDRIVEEIIQGPLIAELKNAIEKVVEEKIPYIVERVITQEIEKIGSSPRKLQ